MFTYVSTTKKEDNKGEYNPDKVYFGYLLWSYPIVRFKTIHCFITFNW